MLSAAARCLAVPCLMLAGTACRDEFAGAGDLRAQRVVLDREVAGLREVVGRLEGGAPLLPANDVMISISDQLVRDLIVAQLPLETDANRFHLRLAEADVQFRGSPIVRLRGQLHLREQPNLAADVVVVGALEDIRVDPATATLLAVVAADHLTIEQATGLSQLLSGSTLDEVARLVRREIEGQLPAIQIPVKLQQQIAFPAITQGPVRIAGARMPIEVVVSQVLATQGNLWIAVKVTPGEFVKTADAPAVADASAADAGAALEDVPSPPAGAIRPAAPAPAKKGAR